MPYLCDTAGIARKRNKKKTKPGKTSPALKAKNNVFSLFCSQSLFEVLARFDLPASRMLSPSLYFLNFLFAQDSPLIHLPGETATKTNVESIGKCTKRKYSFREEN